ncbi:MAG: ABC transporter permease [Segniliparus sp.]|uniref:ABC transporter permease n=1 Tax=Segniliparus sp. TaxID=2804064 RepID=UPI003F341AF2
MVAAVVAAVVWAVGGVVTAAAPDALAVDSRATAFLTAAAGLFAALSAVAVCSARLRSVFAARLRSAAPWSALVGLWFLGWELATAKSGLARPPYFAAPQDLLAQFWRYRALLADSFASSLRLLVLGFLLGAAVGVLTGTAMGWSRRTDYWLHPVIQFIGPVPALAWVPIIFVLFPTSYSGAVFLIALAVWFPVSVLTRAGVASVPRSYYDVAQTLGASTAFQIFRIALPSALPSIFTGLFMGLGVSFVSLTVAENFGVNSGLGWFILWQKGWSAYPAMYAAILLMVVFCGGLMTLLLRIRSRALRWQKDLVRW